MAKNFVIALPALTYLRKLHKPKLRKKTARTNPSTSTKGE